MRLIVLLLMTFAVAGCDRQKAGDQQGEQSVAGPVKGVDRSHKGKPAPDVVFAAPDGGDFTLSDNAGVPTLVNLWATWCAPCVKELPSLDKLAATHLKDEKLALVTVAQDKATPAALEDFFVKHGIRYLDRYHDPEMKLSAALGVEVLPTTILYDSEGRERWRYVGDLDWTSEEAAKLLAEASAKPRA